MKSHSFKSNPEFDCDLFVIGAGSGGVRAGRIAARHGARVIVAEGSRVGGTCVVRGCVPKKLMVYASNYSEDFEDSVAYGWTSDKVSFDWSTLIANKDAEIDRLSAIYSRNLAAAGAELVPEYASLAGPNLVRLASGREIRAAKILLAPGSRPFVPHDLPGHELGITTDEVFDLERMPTRILIVGGGYIAVEFAGIFSGLGVETILACRADQILRGFDGDIRAHLTAEMQKKGIDIRASAELASIERSGTALRATLHNGAAFGVSHVLFATGRVPSTSGLGLEAVGVALKPNGAIKVDSFSRTSAPGIFAVGDVTDRVNLTPAAIREGHAFADNEFGGTSVEIDYHGVPTAVFSQPEVGTVGLSEEDARKTFKNVVIYKTAFRSMKTAFAGNEERTLMKLVVDGETDLVLGCHLCAAGAGEMIQCLAIAVRMGATKADFDATLAVHPTAAEELVTMREPAS